MDERKQSRYVKLSKDQAPLQDIEPGELNQPIKVPQWNVRKCSECGHELPESYSPPADEPWTTGIFGCAEDRESCLMGLFCPCVLFGCNVQSFSGDNVPWIRPCICHAISAQCCNAVGAATVIFNGIQPWTVLVSGAYLILAFMLWGVFGCIVREALQKKYHLKNEPCIPFCVHCCLHWCALCQEHREMKGRLANTATPTTAVNPPPVQQMRSPDDDDKENSEATSANKNNEH